MDSVETVVSKQQTGNQIAARCEGIFLNLRIILWPNSFKKSQTDFKNVFWDVFHTLIKNDASIESKAWDVATALTYAVNYRENEMAEILIENGANVNLSCTNFKTPL